MAAGERGEGGSLVAWRWLQCDCESRDEVSTDKVSGLMDGQSRELDVRMDEGRGGGCLYSQRHFTDLKEILWCIEL